jgi:16S rRNA (uracil1498-N3)-methyltransferase
MTLRVHVDHPLSACEDLSLPEDAARHVQVVRMQPGDALVLFDGRGGEWDATVRAMGRRDVSVDVAARRDVDRELPFDATIAVGMPANERMDALVEKATELGVAAIQPLLMTRSVLRLSGERADKRVAHWQAVAVGAAEQSGRTRVPRIEPVRTLAAWLAGLPGASAGTMRHVMSTGEATTLGRALAGPAAGDGGDGGDGGVGGVGGTGSEAVARPAWCALSGPEGGLTAEEEAEACHRGFVRVSLGARILRADTAPLVWLAQLQAARGG